MKFQLTVNAEGALEQVTKSFFAEKGIDNPNPEQIKEAQKDIERLEDGLSTWLEDEQFLTVEIDTEETTCKGVRLLGCCCVAYG